MSILAVRLLLLLSAITAAVVSAVVLIQSINEGDAPSAWLWAALFVVASLIVAWSFWRLA